MASRTCHSSRLIKKGMNCHSNPPPESPALNQFHPNDQPHAMRFPPLAVRQHPPDRLRIFWPHSLLTAPSPIRLEDFPNGSQVAWALAEAERTGAPKVLYLNLDDSLGEKHKATRHIEPVAWHHDHNESTRRRAAIQKRLLLLGTHLAGRPHRGHAGPAAVPAGFHRTSHQSPPRSPIQLYG